MDHPVFGGGGEDIDFEAFHERIRRHGELIRFNPEQDEQPPVEGPLRPVPLFEVRILHPNWEEHQRLQRVIDRVARGRDGRDRVGRGRAERGRAERDRAGGDQVGGNQVVPRPPIQPKRRYRVGSSFPMVFEAEFDQSHHRTQILTGEWEDLEWVIKYINEGIDFNTMKGDVVVAFNGMKDFVYKINSTLEVSSESAKQGSTDTVDNVFYIDKDHYMIVNPNSMRASHTSGFDGHIVTPKTKITFTIHNIERVEKFTMMRLAWQKGTLWLSHSDIFFIRLARDELIAANPCFERLEEDLKEGIISRKEAKRFAEFLGAYFQRWFYGQDKFYECVLDGYKFGFTQCWKQWDCVESSIDFHTRTMLPGYQTLLDGEAVETPAVRPEQNPSGTCEMWHLKLNPDKTYMKSQVEIMKPIKGHRAQATIFLEESEHGILLLLGINLQMVSCQIARVKVSLFDNGYATIRHVYHRVVHSEQKTIKFVVAKLNDAQLRSLKEDKLSLNVTGYITPIVATNIYSHEKEYDTSTPVHMPGFVNGYFKCKGGKKIGICKEHVAKHSDLLNAMFFNTSFDDCGVDEYEIDEELEIVYDALCIIYHRCHAVPISRIHNVLDLGRFWLCPIITRYMDLAILNAPVMTLEEKLEFAIDYNLDTIKYIMRHQEYASNNFVFSLTDKQMDDLNKSKTDNEIDCGDEGREIVNT